MTDRVEMMRYHDLLTCPEWCVQPDDEHDYEQHHGEWAEVDIVDGGVLRVRPSACWWDDHPDNDWVEVEMAGDGARPAESSSSPDAVGAALLAVADVEAVVDTFAEARDMVDGWRNGTSEWQWAFDGAEDIAARNEAA
jgi:hypothetical protein